MKKYFFISFMFVVIIQTMANAQVPVLETGKNMPDEWIDKDTNHKIVKLTRRDGINMSFYFNNNPFIGNEMIFCGGNKGKNDATPKKEEIYNMRSGNIQMYKVNLNTLDIEQMTHEKFPVHSEIVCANTKQIFYQMMDSVFSLNTDTKQRKLVYVFPKGKIGGIVTVNCDGTLLAGTFSSPKEMSLFKKFPAKRDYFDRALEAKFPHTIFIINIQTGKLENVYTEYAWTNHLQFSPINPTLLMFCHEGTWQKVDRIWTIDVLKRGKPQLMHKRTMPMEIAGHEWFGMKGNDIYFDLQKPRGKTFYVGKVDLNTNKESDYELQRNEWSVHYTTSCNEDLLAGDGGDSTAVAKAPDGKWIYLFYIDGNKLRSTKLVNMKNHDYHLEPNVHFSPDGKWIIFRANFEGLENVYAVEI